jgi:IPT/TIG domain
MAAWGVALVACVACVLDAAPSALAEGPIRVTRYFSANEEQFVVPSIDSSVEVVAIGGHGAISGAGVPGGQGARVLGTLSVTPGETLYVHVGGEGKPGIHTKPGGGGHASDVRTSPLSAGLSPDPRLIVAGAGGGGGGEGRLEGGGSRGGNAEEAGEEGLAEGGAGATATGPGAGGAGECAGKEGALEAGGAGGACPDEGGGGGDGLYGGGGGGGAAASGGGGGGGSSLVPAGGSKALAGGERPQVQISYMREPSAPAATTGAASGVTATAATLNATVNPEGQETACSFEYGTTEHYGASLPCTSAPGGGASPVPVSLALSGLARGTTYHDRVVASNATGTTDGADATFTTSPQEQPVTTGLIPAEGPWYGRNSLTITGQNLENASLVVFEHGTEHVQTYVVTDTSEAITVTVPRSPAGGITSGFYVVVTTPGGTTAQAMSSLYTYLEAPWIEYLTPRTVTAGGSATATIVGLDLSGVTAVHFGATEASSFAYEKGTLHAQVPAGLAPGLMYVTVTTAAGTSPALSNARFRSQSEPPEFGRCGYHPNIGNKPIENWSFKTAYCLKEEYPGNYEWEPGVTKGGFTGKAKGSWFEGTNLARITCTTATDSGTISTPVSLSGVVLTLSHCHTSSGQACTTQGQASGVIATATLEGAVGWQARYKKAALDLFPAGHSGPFVSYSCGGATTTLEGSVIVPAKANDMAPTAAWKFSETGGHQVPEAFQYGSPDVLRSTSGEQFGFYATISQSFQQSLELSTDH